MGVWKRGILTHSTNRLLRSSRGEFVVNIELCVVVRSHSGSKYRNSLAPLVKIACGIDFGWGNMLSDTNDTFSMS